MIQRIREGARGCRMVARFSRLLIIITLTAATCGAVARPTLTPQPPPVSAVTTQYYQTANFKIEYTLGGPNGVPDRYYVVALGEELKAAQEKLEDMHFKTRRNEVRVVVKDLPGTVGGQAVRSKRGARYSWIKIDNFTILSAPPPPPLPPYLRQQANKLKVTAAHEYFHLCQDLYLPSYGWLFTSDYEWFKEACALWFEDIFDTSVNTYISQLDKNKDFILEPLNTNTPYHGYGAASFVKYLAERFDKDVVREIFEQFEAQAEGPIKGIEKVLQRRGAKLSDVFGDFATRYWTSRDFDEAGSWGRPIDWLAFLSHDDPLFEFSFEQGPLSARGFGIQLKPGTAGVILFKVEGTNNPLQKVQVFCGNSEGVDIYSDTDWGKLLVKLPHVGAVSGASPIMWDQLREMRSPRTHARDRDLVYLVVINSDPEKTLKGTVKLCMPMHTLPDITTLQLKPEDLPYSWWTVNPPDPKLIIYYSDLSDPISNLWSRFSQDAKQIYAESEQQIEWKILTDTAKELGLDTIEGYQGLFKADWPYITIKSETDWAKIQICEDFAAVAAGTEPWEGFEANDSFHGFAAYSGHGYFAWKCDKYLFTVDEELRTIDPKRVRSWAEALLTNAQRNGLCSSVPFQPRTWDLNITMTLTQCCCAADAKTLWDKLPTISADEYEYQNGFAEGPYVCAIRGSLIPVKNDWLASRAAAVAEVNDFVRSSVDTAAAAMKIKIRLALEQAEAKYGAFF